MKILSLHQPWATLVSIGAKNIETRSWATDHRGPIAIHAAKRWNGTLSRICLREPFRGALFGPGSKLDPIAYHRKCGHVLDFGLPFGAIVAVADLVGCRICSATRWAAGHELSVHSVVAGEMALGDFSPGRYAWMLANVRGLAEPIPWRGCQGLRDLPAGVAASLDRAAFAP